MEKKEIILQSEKSEKIKQNKIDFSSATPFLNLKRRKSSIKYSQLKFNQDILINILKKANLKKMHKNQNNTDLNLNNKSENKNRLYKNNKISYNLNKKFHDLPVLSNFHNITDETINDLLKSDENNNEFKPINTKKEVQKIINLKANFNYKNSIDKILKNKLNNTYFYNNIYSNNNGRRYSNKNQLNYKIYSYTKTRTDFKRLSNKKRSAKIKKNELYINFTNSFPYLKNKKQIINTSENNSKNKDKNNNINNNLLIKSKKKEPIIHTISSNLKKIKINKLGKLNSNIETKKWLESIKDSIEKFDLFNRGSKIDRLLFYMIKPEECFEENVLDVKPGDKYQLFKNQIAKHKSKLENILVDIKLNQIKNEYLMKKYIFDLLSRRKKIY